MRDIWHVIPLNDLREHMSLPICWCNPVEDKETPNLWVHNALDGREDYETKKRKPS